MNLSKRHSYAKFSRPSADVCSAAESSCVWRHLLVSCQERLSRACAVVTAKNENVRIPINEMCYNARIVAGMRRELTAAVYILSLWSDESRYPRENRPAGLGGLCIHREMRRGHASGVSYLSSPEANARRPCVAAGVWPRCGC